jgi:hypothetical protein
MIDTSYGWTAEDEMETSPRKFYFVTNCADYRAEAKRLEIVLWGDGATEQRYKQAENNLRTSLYRNWSSLDYRLENNSHK